MHISATMPKVSPVKVGVRRVPVERLLRCTCSRRPNTYLMCFPRPHRLFLHLRHPDCVPTLFHSIPSLTHPPLPHNQSISPPSNSPPWVNHVRCPPTPREFESHQISHRLNVASQFMEDMERRSNCAFIPSCL